MLQSSIKSSLLLKLPLCAPWPKSPWSSCLLADMCLTHHLLATCCISSSSAKEKKSHKRFIETNFSFSGDCGWYDRLFILSFSLLLSLQFEQLPRRVCPFPACQTAFNNKIHLFLFKAVLSSYPWRSDACTPFYHLSHMCCDCKYPDNTLVSPSKPK